MKNLLNVLLFLLLLAGAALMGYFFLWPEGERRDTLEFVPDDFVFMVQSVQPVEDWETLSDSDIWKYLKGVPYFEEISTSADQLDSIVTQNSALVKLVSLGELRISAHLTQGEEYDFIYLVNLEEKNLAKLREVLRFALTQVGYQVNIDNYYNINIFDLYDPEEREHLYLATVDNVLICSAQKPLLKKAIDQSEKGSLVANVDFARLHNEGRNQGIYTVYLNYNQLQPFAELFTTEPLEAIEDWGNILSFSSFDLRVKPQVLEMEGQLKQVDSVASFFNIFHDVRPGKSHVENVLPSNTAMYMSMGFDDFLDFQRRFETFYQTQQPEEYKDYLKRRQKVEKWLRVSFEEDVFSWMSDEMVTAIIPNGNTYDYYALLHFDNYDKTKGKLDHLNEQIRKRTPVKFEQIDYRGYEIHYLEMKGFFKLFFKKLFSSIEKPHYTYLDDYVVFSNDTTSLQRVIDRYLRDDVLRKSEGYQGFKKQFPKDFNIFSYVQSEHFFEYMAEQLEPADRRDFEANREYWLSFPHMGLHINPRGGLYQAKLKADFQPQGAAEPEPIF